eukprot:gnl/MRDRNA2_/MRDRNA2_83173_c0_seq1.p1 gnl/MRDRNA2_/MRDRNA2_83173_c0~~gnl/MRDRNA2_/MRDRNA2_83173_c0_seq1.p1  ORF type:complete len:211 (+),score=1.06 gnl/MRDRNA2_/MRDRNA2_83173_c0_seq1:2-634(+)
MLRSLCDSPNSHILWQVLSQNHCSFRFSHGTKKLCTNSLNNSGRCHKRNCPLGNSSYATIVEEWGKCYLMLKNPEQLYSPRKAWTKIRLKKNYADAMVQIDRYLMSWPLYFINATKQRLTKITQYLNRLNSCNLISHASAYNNDKKPNQIKTTKNISDMASRKIQQVITREILSRLRSGPQNESFDFSDGKNGGKWKLEKEILTELLYSV